MGACCSSTAEKMFDSINQTHNDNADECQKIKKISIPHTKHKQEISDKVDEMFEDIESDFYQFNNLKDIDGTFVQYVREIDAYNHCRDIKRKKHRRFYSHFTPKHASSISGSLINGFANYSYNCEYNNNNYNTNNTLKKQAERMHIPKDLLNICCEYLYVSRNEHVTKIFIDDYIDRSNKYPYSGLKIEIPIKFRLIDDKGNQIVDDDSKNIKSKHKSLNVYCNSHNIFRLVSKNIYISKEIQSICLKILNEIKISEMNSQHQNAHDIVITFDSNFKTTSTNQKIQYFLQSQTNNLISHRWLQGCVILNCPLFDINSESFGVEYNSNTNVFIFCNNFFGINKLHNRDTHMKNEYLKNQLILKCNGEITYEQKQAVQLYFGSISLQCKEMFISGHPKFGSFSPHRGIIILCDKDIDVDNCEILSWGYIYIKCNNLISNGKIRFVNVKHEFQKKLCDSTFDVWQMNEKLQVNQFNKHNWNRIKDYEKGFDNINCLQFNNKKKRLNAMISKTVDDCNNINDNDNDNSIMVSNSNKWMFLNVKNDVRVSYNNNDYSHSDAECYSPEEPPIARFENKIDIEKGRPSFSCNWYDTLTDALIVKCHNWNTKIGNCKTYNGFRIFQSTNLNEIK